MDVLADVWRDPFLILGAVGLLLLAWRLWPRRAVMAPALKDWPFVSIVVPARNEALVLPDLLVSLRRLDYPAYEVIVVDDRSEDGTGAVAVGLGARVVHGVEQRQPSAGDATDARWMGKQWACHQGYLAARGDLLLFTDADTVHAPDSLRRAVAELSARRADLLSVLPFHAGTTLWERLTGPFHLLLLAVTAPYARPRPGRVYAIGQYLLFTRPAYERMGGHGAVRSSWVEDLPLANLCLKEGMRYRLMMDTGAPARPLFSVRMYATLGDFVRGWRRNFRAGLGGSSILLPLEMVAMMAAITGAGRFLSSPSSAALVVASVLVLAVAQRRLGRFSILGSVFAPLSLLLFCLVSVLAAYDMLLARPLRWKGRAYDVKATARPAP